MLITKGDYQSHSRALSAEAEALSTNKTDLHVAAFLAQVAEIVDPDNVDAQIVHARCMFEAEFFNATLNKLTSILETRPGNPTALALTGRCHLKLHENEPAERALRQAFQSDPNRQDWGSDWAAALQRVEGDGTLRDQLIDHLERHDDHWRLHIRLGQCLERLGDIGGAQVHYSDAARLASNEAGVHVALADFAFRQRDTQPALAAKVRAVELSGSDVTSICAVETIRHPSWSDESIARMRSAVDSAREHVCDQSALSRMSARLDILYGADAETGHAVTALSAADGAFEAGLFDISQGCVPRAPLTSRDVNSFIPPLFGQGLTGVTHGIDVGFLARRLLLHRVLNGSPAGIETLSQWIASVDDVGPLQIWILANLAYRVGAIDRARSLYQAWARTVDEDKPGKLMGAHLSLCRLVERQGPKGEVDVLWDIYLQSDDLLLAVVRNAFSLLDSYPTKGEEVAAALARQVHRLPDLLRHRKDGPTLWSHAILATCFLDGDDRHYDRVCGMAVEYFRDQVPRAPLPVPAHPRSDRIRVGYVMTDFQHQDLPLEQYALTFHDLGRFDPVIYYFTPEATAHVRPDRPCPPTLADWDGQLRNIDSMPAADAADLIRGDKLDLLVDTVGWWAREIPELFLRRLAPVQATWLGLGRPGKAGVMDYLVGCDMLLPRDMDDRYPESLVRLSPTYIPPKPVADGVPKTPRALLGLPDDAFVYSGYHQVMKVTERSVRLWLEILRRTPGSYLILPAIGLNAVAELANEAGVGLDRISGFRWVGSELENMSRIGAADLYLDTIPFNASGLSSYDALAMGVPRITLSGPNLYSRFGSVFLHALGLDDLICRSEADFVDLAVALHDDPQRLSDIRGRLQQARASSPVMHPAPLMRSLETAWQRIVERSRSGQPPIGFDVPAHEAWQA